MVAKKHPIHFRDAMFFARPLEVGSNSRGRCTWIQCNPSVNNLTTNHPMKKDIDGYGSWILQHLPSWMNNYSPLLSSTTVPIIIHYYSLLSLILCIYIYINICLQNRWFASSRSTNRTSRLRWWAKSLQDWGALSRRHLGPAHSAHGASDGSFWYIWFNIYANI